MSAEGLALAAESLRKKPAPLSMEKNALALIGLGEFLSEREQSAEQRGETADSAA